LDVDVRIALRRIGRPLVEEEDRLDLRAGRAQEAQAPLLRPRVRALVREDDAGRIGLEAKRADEAVTATGEPVRPGVVLGQPPERRLLVANKDAVPLP